MKSIKYWQLEYCNHAVANHFVLTNTGKVLCTQEMSYYSGEIVGLL
jgi:hypothetical protein